MLKIKNIIMSISLTFALTSTVHASVISQEKLWIVNKQGEMINTTLDKIYDDDKLEVFVRGGDEYSEDKLNKVISKFEDNIEILKSKSIFKKADIHVLDNDHNNKIAVFFNDMNDMLLGYFRDYNDDPSNLYYNNKDMIELNRSFISKDGNRDENLAGVMAIHELQHLTQYGYDPHEIQLINEGFSMYVQYITVNDNDNTNGWVRSYLSPPNMNSLSMDTFNYGSAFLLLKYIDDNFGDDTLIKIYKDKKTGIDSILNNIPVSRNELYSGLLDSNISMENARWMPSYYDTLTTYTDKEVKETGKVETPSWKFIVGSNVKITSNSNLIVKKLTYKKKRDLTPIQIENIEKDSSGVYNIGETSDKNVIAFTPVICKGDSTNWDYKIEGTPINLDEQPPKPPVNTFPKDMDLSKIMFEVEPKGLLNIDTEYLNSLKEFPKILQKSGLKDDFHVNIVLKKEISEDDIIGDSFLLYNINTKKYVNFYLCKGKTSKGKLMTDIDIYPTQNLESGEYYIFMNVKKLKPCKMKVIVKSNNI